MNGWIKLHAQVLDNEIWRNDRTAWHVFEYLLLKAYSGKPQGVVVTSRYQIADMVGGNNNTIYKALKRLEKAKMVTSVATNKKTTIRICNWNNYQGNGNQSGNNKVTTKQQQSNTLNRYKNKDKDITTNVVTENKVGALYYQVVKTLNLPVLNHNTLRAKIKALETEDSPETIINYLEFMRDKYTGLSLEYKPHINNALDLYSKRKQIENIINQQINVKPNVEVIS